jgi:hypothetical protein
MRTSELRRFGIVEPGVTQLFFRFRAAFGDGGRNAGGGTPRDITAPIIRIDLVSGERQVKLVQRFH